MNLDENDYSPTQFILDMYSPLGAAYNPTGKLEYHFSYNLANFYVTPRGRIYVFGPQYWTQVSAQERLPAEVATAARLWAKAEYKALPVYEFLDKMFNGVKDDN